VELIALKEGVLAMLKATVSIIIFSFLAGCAASEPRKLEVQSGPDAEVIMGNLHRVDGARAAVAFVDPEVDFSQYHSFWIRDLQLDEVKIVQPPRELSSRSREWVLDDQDKEQLARWYKEAMEKELQQGGYPMANEPGEGVLILTAAITRIEPTAPKDDFKSRTNRSGYVTGGAGRIYIAAQFNDGADGKILAALEDASDGMQSWGMNNRVTNGADVRRRFSSWARQLRARLDIIHAGNFSGAQ
jgi:hypothetical protein